MTNTVLAPFKSIVNQFSYVNTEAARIFHGRGHCYEGLNFINVDWFAPVVWLVVYGQPEEQLLDDIKGFLTKFAQEQNEIACVYFQQRGQGKSEQTLLYGTMPEQVFAHEDGAKFELELAHNQNIGYLNLHIGRQAA